MQLVFLGTGGSWPSPIRNVVSIALKMDGEIILFDCGEGTQQQIMRSNLSFMQISKILITHFHGDHFLGLNGLIQTMSFNDRTNPLYIYGPHKTKQFVENFLAIGYFRPTFDTIIHELADGDVVRCNGYDIKVRRVSHTVPCLCYCVEEWERKGKFDVEKAKKLGIPRGQLYAKLQKGESITIDGKTITPDMVLGPPRRGRKIVYSGDTLPCDSVVELAKNCDVLIHEGTLDASLSHKAKKYKHSTAKEAAEIAKLVNARVLFLVHVSPRYEDATILHNEMREIFENSSVATDLLVYEVRFPD